MSNDLSDPQGSREAPPANPLVETAPLPMETTLRAWEREATFYESQRGKTYAFAAQTLRILLGQMRRSYAAECRVAASVATPAESKDEDPLHTGDDARLDCVTSIRAALEEIIDEEGKPECDHCADLLSGALDECDTLDALIVATVKRERAASVATPASQEESLGVWIDRTYGHPAASVATAATKFPAPDDGALMQICDEQIDWIASKVAISRDTGKLALLSILMAIREQSAASVATEARRPDVDRIRGLLNAALTHASWPDESTRATAHGFLSEIAKELSTRPTSPVATEAPQQPVAPSEDFILDFLAAYYGFPSRAVMATYPSWEADIRDDVKLIQSWATLKGADDTEGPASANHRRIRDRLLATEAPQRQETTDDELTRGDARYSSLVSSPPQPPSGDK